MFRDLDPAAYRKWMWQFYSGYRGPTGHLSVAHEHRSKVPEGQVVVHHWLVKVRTVPLHVLLHPRAGARAKTTLWGPRDLREGGEEGGEEGEYPRG